MRRRMLACLLTTLVAACGEGTSDFSDDNLPEQVLDPAKGDYVAIPFATYHAASATTAGRLLALTWTAGGICHRVLTKTCSHGSCTTKTDDPLASWSKAGTTYYVRFERENGTLIDRYAFKLDGDTLKLRKVSTSTWQTLTNSEPLWCQYEADATRRDCSDQSDAPPECAGTWTCESSACVRHCDYTLCANAGGTCVSGACDGHVLDADAYPCKSSKLCCAPGPVVRAFDPVAADSLSKAFDIAVAQIPSAMKSPTVSLVTVQGDPVTVGTSYADTVYTWHYVIVAQGTGSPTRVITVAYPGWTARSTTGTPMGAYLAQADIAATVKLGFAAIVDHATTAHVTLASCPLDPTNTSAPGFVDLRGNFGPGGIKWFWEFGCAAQAGMYSFDAGTGALME